MKHSNYEHYVNLIKPKLDLANVQSVFASADFSRKRWCTDARKKLHKPLMLDCLGAN